MARFIALLFVCLFALDANTPAEAGRVGVAAVVKNQVNGSVAGVIRVGSGVSQNEVISTGNESSTQLLFQDETSLTIGPTSRVTLDRFVYNPATRSGDVVVNVARGTFRFVSGSARPGGYTIKTPAASIGLRGTVIEGFINALGELLLVIVEGAVDVVTANGTTVAVSAGQYITVSASGALSGPSAWTGRTLDIEGGQEFILDTDDPIEDQRNQLNDALDSRDIDITFPPELDDQRGGGGAKTITSDIRLKADVRYLATFERKRLYSFRYRGEDVVRVGVMAQDLVDDPRYAHTVHIGENGFYSVDYAALGLNMVTLDEWRREGVGSVVAGVTPKHVSLSDGLSYERGKEKD